MNKQTLDAIKTLIRCSALNNHPHVERCIDPDSMRFDLQALNEWCWSSGEEVLVGVLTALYGSATEVRLHELYNLDEMNREAVIMALRIRLLGHAENLLDEAQQL